jgi:hypothetical protein
VRSNSHLGTFRHLALFVDWHWHLSTCPGTSSQPTFGAVPLHLYLHLCFGLHLSIAINPTITSGSYFNRDLSQQNEADCSASEMKFWDLSVVVLYILITALGLCYDRRLLDEGRYATNFPKPASDVIASGTLAMWELVYFMTQ